MPSEVITLWFKTLIVLVLYNGGLCVPDCHYLTATRNGKPITSPGYPDTYPSHARECWIITADDISRRVKLTFRDFSLERHSICNYDELEIRDGGESTDDLLGSFCGTTVPCDVMTSGIMMYLTFRSDGSVRDQGFYATFRATDEDFNPYSCGDDHDDGWLSHIDSPIPVIIGVAVAIAFAIIVVIAVVRCRRMALRSQQHQGHAALFQNPGIEPPQGPMMHSTPTPAVRFGPQQAPGDPMPPSYELPPSYDSVVPGTNQYTKDGRVDCPSPPPIGGPSFPSAPPVGGPGGLGPPPIGGPAGPISPPMGGHGGPSPAPMVGPVGPSPPPMGGHGGPSPAPMGGHGCPSPPPIVAQGYPSAPPSGGPGNPNPPWTGPAYPTQPPVGDPVYTNQPQNGGLNATIQPPGRGPDNHSQATTRGPHNRSRSPARGPHNRTDLPSSGRGTRSSSPSRGPSTPSPPESERYGRYLHVPGEPLANSLNPPPPTSTSPATQHFY